MSFIEGLLYPWILVLGPQLHMLVIMLVVMKALLSGYNIDPRIIYEAWNAKVLCLLENAASSWPLFLYNIVKYSFLFDHSKSTIAAAGPTRSELVPDMVDQ